LSTAPPEKFADLLASYNELAGSVTSLPPPVQITATPGSGSVTLNWNFDGSAVTFNIYRGTEPGGETLYRTNYPGSFISFFDGSLSAITYYYAVAAVNAFGHSSPSNEASVTPGTALLATPTVTATPGVGSIDLSWNDVALADFYDVYRSTHPQVEEVYAVGVSTASFSDLAVSDGTTYYYKVAAANADGQGNLSSEANATGGGVVPTTPTLTVQAGDSSATLNWSFTGSAVTINIYRGTDPGKETLIQSGYPGSSTSFFNSGLTNFTTYYYYITAVNVSESDPSNEVSVRPGITPIVAPLLAAVAGDNQVTLTWSAIPVANTYHIWRSTRPNAEEVYLADASATTSFVDGVANGTTYYYKVAGNNADGQGLLSNEASSTPGSSGPTPSLLAVSPGNGSATLNWNYNGAAVTFNIYRSTTTGEETLYRTNQAGFFTTFFDSGLANGTTYFYKMTAVNSDSEGTQSLEASVTPGTAPLAPPLLEAVPGAGMVTLSWSDVPLATSYNINRSGRPSSEELYQVGVTGTTFNDTGVVAGMTYFYTVNAVNANGQGQASNEAIGTP
jgi:fibronectin type 3 domain-containing protein